jgi:hypothetical protein
MFSAFFGPSRSESPRKDGKKRRHERRLKLECLEPRAMLTAVMPLTPADLLTQSPILADPAAIIASFSHSLSGRHVGDFAGTYTGTATGSTKTKVMGKTYTTIVNATVTATVTKNGKVLGFAFNIHTQIGTVRVRVNGTWTSANGTFAIVKTSGGGVTAKGTLTRDGTDRTGTGTWSISQRRTVYGRTATVTGKGFWNIHRV